MLGALPARLPQMHDRRAPAAVLRVVEGERDHLGVFGQDGMDGAPQVADAFAVNDSHLEDAAFPARCQVIQHQVFDLPWAECVQVQHAINRELDRLVHRSHQHTHIKPALSLLAGKSLILSARLLLSRPGMKIRQAVLSDAPIITDFNLRLAAETEDLRLDAARVGAGVTALLKDPAKGVYYVAEVDGVVAGQLMITYEWSDWRNGSIWWIQSVYVKHEFRGQGVFRELFNHLQELARQQRNIPALRLYVHADNVRAQGSYQKLGMTRTKYEVFEMDIAAH